MTNIEFFRSVQEEVSLCAIRKTRRNLLNASLQDFRVEHGAIRPGEASLVWRVVERASAAPIGVDSVLDSLITAMGVISSVFRHRTGLEGTGKRKGPNSRWGSCCTEQLVRPGRDRLGCYIASEKKRGIDVSRRLLIGQTYTIADREFGGSRSPD